MNNYSNGNNHNINFGEYDNEDDDDNEEEEGKEIELADGEELEELDQNQNYNQDEEDVENNSYENNNINYGHEENEEDETAAVANSLIGEEGVQFYQQNLEENEEENGEDNGENINNGEVDEIEENNTQEANKEEFDEEEPLYIMTLEVDKGKSETIKIYSHSNPNELAFNFCKHYDQEFSAMSYLSAEIESLIMKFNDKNQEDNTAMAANDNQDQILELEEEEEHISTEKNKYEPHEKRFHHCEDGNIIPNENNLDININLIELEEENNENTIIEKEDDIIPSGSIIYTDKIVNVSMNNLIKNEEVSLEDQDEVEYLDEQQLQLSNEDEGENYIDQGDQMEEDEDLNYKDNKSENEEYVITNDDIMVEEIEGNYNIKSNERINEQYIENNEQFEEQDIDNNNNEQYEEQYNDNEEENDYGNPNQEYYSKEKYEDQHNYEENLQDAIVEDESNLAGYENENLPYNETRNIDEKDTHIYPLQFQPNQTKSRKNNFNSIHLSNNEYSEKCSPNISPNKFLIPASNNNSHCLQKSPSFLTCITNIKNQNKNLNIYDRLFRDAEIRRRLPKGRQSSDYKAMTNSNSNLSIFNKNNQSYRTNTNKANYGEYLYQKGKILKEEKMRKLAHQRVEIDQKNAENNTFKPRIHEYIPAHEIRCNTYNNTDYLRYRDELEVNRNSVIINDGQQQQQITFKAKNNVYRNSQDNLNLDSTPQRQQQKSTAKTNSFNNIIDTESQVERKLQRLEKLRTEINSQFTFKPNISQKYQFDSNFIERQNAFKEASVKNRKDLEEEHKRLVDEFGNPLFKPRLVSKSKNYNRNGMTIQGDRMVPKDVYTSNYEFANRYRLSKDNLVNKYNTSEPSIVVNNVSENIFNKIKELAFRKLFKDLDADQDDLITVQSIALKNIPNTIKKMIDPIVSELKEQNETLNESEFVQAMSHLFQSLNYEDRKVLIYYYKERNSDKHIPNGKTNNDNFNFKPVINNKSKKIASKIDTNLNRCDSTNNVSANPVDSNSFFRLSTYTSGHQSAIDDWHNLTYKNFKKNVLLNE